MERHSRAVHLIASNPRFLNAEDQTTIGNMEIAVDVAILIVSVVYFLGLLKVSVDWRKLSTRERVAARPRWVWIAGASLLLLYLAKIVLFDL